MGKKMPQKTGFRNRPSTGLDDFTKFWFNFELIFYQESKTIKSCKNKFYIKIEGSFGTKANIFS